MNKKSNFLGIEGNPIQIVCFVLQIITVISMLVVEFTDIDNPYTRFIDDYGAIITLVLLIIIVLFGGLKFKVKK